MTLSDTDAPAPVPALSTSKPYPEFPLLRKETLHAGDAERGLFPVRKLTFQYAPGKTLPLHFATDVVKVVHPKTGRAKSYSPTSEPGRVGEFDLIVKVYPGGGVSEFLDSVPVGAGVAMFGPLPPPYRRPDYTPAPRVVAIALGIGITHAFTTLRDTLERRTDAHVTLVVAVQYAEQDVVLTEEIAALEKTYAGRFDVVRVATKERVEGWHHGRVDSEFVKKLIQGAESENVRVMVVGTKAMIRAVWEELGKIGLSYEENALVKKATPFTMLYRLLWG